MRNLLHKQWIWTAGLATLTGLWAIVPAVAQAQSNSSAPRSSFTDSISSGMSKFGQAVTPKPTKTSDDPVSLQSKGKPGVDLYVAVARLYEESGRLEEAEAQYKRGLKEAPTDLRVLIGYARLKDRMNDPQEALRIYKQAAQAHPQEPSVFNNMAVHYARSGMLRDAADSLGKAVQLRPKEPKYRNNMATLLVELGRTQEALEQLRAVYDDSVAHYNLGYLLNKKGQTQAASQEFTAALRINPSMAAARQWLERINSTAARNAPPASYDPRYGVRRGGPTTPEGPSPSTGDPFTARGEPRMASNPSAYRYGSAAGQSRMTSGAEDNGRATVRLLPPPSATYVEPIDPPTSDFRVRDSQALRTPSTAVDALPLRLPPTAADEPAGSVAPTLRSPELIAPTPQPDR